ncbi:hypothetical protein [Nitrosospira briensis]|uniref:hypothetical protein n=1 Tax=Nitrosospira briensis TaxID=35799 RepID=UPI00046805C6|nr:hypothetical protein [Nitrosospira briensis]
MPVNLSDPLGAKAGFVLRGSEGINELLTGSIPDGSTLTTETTAGGVAIVPSGSWTAWRYVEAGVDPFVSGDFTYNWYGVLRDDAAQEFLRVAGASYGWAIGTTSYSPGVLYMYCVNLHSGYAKYSNLTYDITDNSLHTITVRYTEVQNKVEFFLDGALIGSGDFWKEAGAMGPDQNFSITGHATKPFKHITAQAYIEAISDAEIARLVSDPNAIFTASPKTLTGSNATQANTSGVGYISVPGNLFGLPSSQSNLVSSGSITRTQTLTGGNATQVNACSVGSTDPYGRLRGLLKPVQKGEWLQVNTSTFLDCTMPRSDDAPGYIDWSHFAILNAWPSVAWDTEKGNLIVWGGGHANYGGNEIYIWNGQTGQWKRGSLPSKFTLTGDPVDAYILGKDAPQSSHTYCNNVYLPNNRMFCTFGGAAYSSGKAFREQVGTGSRAVGPWCFDLALADPNKVGGATGSGWDTTNVKAGSNAWYNRIDMVDGGYSLDSLSHINGATVCVDEGGKDVCYFTMDSASGFPYWYRYEFGDIRAGGRDTFSYLTQTQNSVLYESWGVFDSKRGMFYRGGLGDLSGIGSPAKATELAAVHVSTAVWNSYDTPIRLVRLEDGTPLPTNISSRSFGAAYGEHDDLLYLWTGWEDNPGTYYTVAIPEWSPVTGWASTTWAATEHVPTGPTPIGNYQISILGRMRYVPALKSVVIVDQPRTETAQDASVWMLKTTEAELDLIGDGLAQANTGITGAVIQLHALSAAGSVQANVASTGAIAAGAEHNLVAAAATQANIGMPGTISQAHVLNEAGSTQANAASVGAITTGVVHDLAPSPSTQANISASVVVSQAQALVCPASVQDNVAAASAIVQQHMLIAASSIQANLASSGSLRPSGLLPTPSWRTMAVVGELRVIEVEAENRTLSA